MPIAELKNEEIHAYSLEILAETGLMVKNPGILARLKEHEVRCDEKSGMIFFTPSQVEAALVRAPKRFVLGARKPEPSIELSATSPPRFMPSGTGVAVIDPFSHQRRPSLTTDVEQLVAVQQRLPQVDIVRPMVTATDLPPFVSDLFECLSALRYSSKHFLHRVNRPEDVQPLMEMAMAVAGGRAGLAENPVMSTVYCPISPLTFAPHIAETMLACAGGGLPVCVLSMAMGGATSPATALGEVMLINAEILGGITLIQTLCPGAAVIYGSVSSVMDMSTTVLALGAPERALINGWLARLASWYGVPSMMGGMSTDAKFMDFQAGFEKALTAVPLLDHCNILFGLGNMNSANTYSVEQLVADADMAGALTCSRSSGDASDGRVVCDLIKNVGPGGHFLGQDHTFDNFRNFWRPAFSNRSSEYTADDSRERFCEQVRNRTQTLLAQPKEKAIDAATERELERIYTTVSNR